MFGERFLVRLKISAHGFRNDRFDTGGPATIYHALRLLRQQVRDFSLNERCHCGAPRFVGGFSDSKPSAEHDLFDARIGDERIATLLAALLALLRSR
jgi:hypothetical protein